MCLDSLIHYNNYDRFQRYEEGIKHYNLGLDEIRESKNKNKNLEAIILNNLGDSYLEIGKISIGKANINAGKKIRQDILNDLRAKKELNKIESAETNIGSAHVILGKASRYSNDLNQAVFEYSRAISIFDQYRDQSAKANVLLERGETYRRIARQNFESDLFDNVKINEKNAETDIKIAFDLCQQYGLLNFLDTAHRRRGRLFHDQGLRVIGTSKKLEYYDKALTEFENALEISISTRDVREELESLKEIAFLADDHAEVVTDREKNKAKIQKELKRLEKYIELFENGLKRHKRDLHRLYNYDVYAALLRLEKAAFSYASGRKETSLNLYIQAYVGLAKSPGYGVANYLIYLPHLFNNIRRLNNPTLEKNWCNKIKKVWEKEKLHQTRDEMVAKIEEHLLGLGER